MAKEADMGCVVAGAAYIAVGGMAIEAEGSTAAVGATSAYWWCINCDMFECSCCWAW